MDKVISLDLGFGDFFNYSYYFLAFYTFYYNTH